MTDMDANNAPDERSVTASRMARESIRANGWDGNPMANEWVDASIALTAMAEWEELVAEFGKETADALMPRLGSFAAEIVDPPEGFDAGDGVVVPGFLVHKESSLFSCGWSSGTCFESFGSRRAAEWFLHPVPWMADRDLLTSARDLDVRVRMITEAGVRLDDLEAVGAAATPAELSPETFKALVTAMGVGTNGHGLSPRGLLPTGVVRVVSHDARAFDFDRGWQALQASDRAVRTATFFSRCCADAFSGGGKRVPLRLIDNFLFDPQIRRNDNATPTEGLLAGRDVAVNPVASIVAVALRREGADIAESCSQRLALTQWDDLGRIPALAKHLAYPPAAAVGSPREFWTHASLLATRAGSGVVVGGDEAEAALDAIACGADWVVTDSREALHAFDEFRHFGNPSLEETQERCAGDGELVAVNVEREEEL